MPNPHQPHVMVVGDDGRELASAMINDGDRASVNASMRVEAGQLPTGTRARLVDALVKALHARSCDQVTVALPLGDAELLQQVRDRCEASEVRAAGTTCLVEARLPR